MYNLVMKIPVRVKSGLISLFDVLNNQEEGPVSAFAISQRQNISSNILEKVMRDLRIAGIVKANRGPKGGYKVERDLESISLYEIFSSLDDKLVQRIEVKRDCIVENRVNKIMLDYLKTTFPLLEQFQIRKIKNCRVKQNSCNQDKTITNFV